MAVRYYKLTIRTTVNERMEVIVESENFLNLIESLSGNKFTFVNKEKPDDRSFSLFAHIIQQIHYETTTVMPHERNKIYTIHATF